MDVDDYIEKPLQINQTKKIIERILDSKKVKTDIDSGNSKGKIEINGAVNVLV